MGDDDKRTKLTNEKVWRGDLRMPILDTTNWAWGEDKQPELIPAGARATLRILRVVERETTNKRKYLAISFESLDHPNAEDIYEQFYYLSDPTFTQKERNRETRKWMAFKRCFNIHLPSSGETRTEEWTGAEGRVEIGQKADRMRGAVNNITEFLGTGGEEENPF